jgi:hypothetical protein
LKIIAFLEAMKQFLMVEKTLTQRKEGLDDVKVFFFVKLGLVLP